MATDSSILVYKIPQRPGKSQRGLAGCKILEGPGRLQSMGSQRLRHNWACVHIIALRCCVSFCSPTVWVSCKYTHPSSFLCPPPRPQSHPSRSTQSTELSSLCYTVASQFCSLSRVWLFATPWTAACQASLSITNSRSLLASYFTHSRVYKGFPGGASGKEPACQCRRHEMWVRSLSHKDLLEEGMATHSSILAWRIPWAEEPGGLQSIGSHRVRCNWSNSAHTQCLFLPCK